MKRTAGAVLLLLLALLVFSCTDGVLAPKGRWNPGDTHYDPTTDPGNTADKVPFDPLSLTATAVSDTAIDLAWRDASAHEEGFRVYMKIGSAGTYAALTPDIAANAAAYRCTALTPSTEYWFKVTAVNAVGESGPTNEAHATTLAPVVISSTNAMTEFGFGSPAASGLIDDTAKTIAVTVPYGTDVTALVAVFTHTGAAVKVGTMAQVSGTTANDFTSAVQYVVTAQDGTPATYTVTVTVAAAGVRKLYHLDAGVWTADPDPPVGTVAITAASSDVYAMTGNGTLYRLDGGWQQGAVPAPAGVVSLAGCSGNLYALTSVGQILTLDGGWIALSVPAPASSIAIAGVGTVLYALTSVPVLHYMDGNAWVSMTTPTGAVSVADLDGHPYCLTNAGKIHYYDGGWVEQAVSAPAGSTAIAGGTGTLYVLVTQ